MAQEFRFVKYEACGNDFILRDELEGPTSRDEERSRLAKILCDRHHQVGADGILFVEGATGADASMRHFQPDGSESTMCGNGVRCVGAYVSEKLRRPSVDILTADGVKRVVRVGADYRVEMGRVRTTRADLARFLADPGEPTDSMMDFAIQIPGRALRGSLVNTGEPHFVLRTEDLATEDVGSVGAAVNEDRKRFPRGVCVDFVQVSGPHSIRIRTYESGAYYETMACGTGATASAAVALALGWVRPGAVDVATKGGPIRIEVGPDGEAYMTGPARRVYEGRLAIEP